MILRLAVGPAKGCVEAAGMIGSVHTYSKATYEHGPASWGDGMTSWSTLVLGHKRLVALGWLVVLAGGGLLVGKVEWS